MRLDMFQEMKDLFRVVSLSDPVPAGGFILPQGEIVRATGEHEAMCQWIGTTLRQFIRSGGVRFCHVNGCIGIDIPPVLTVEQVDTLRLILRGTPPHTVIVSRCRRRGKPSVRVIRDDTVRCTYHCAMTYLRESVEFKQEEKP